MVRLCFDRLFRLFQFNRLNRSRLFRRLKTRNAPSSSLNQTVLDFFQKIAKTCTNCLYHVHFFRQSNIYLFCTFVNLRKELPDSSPGIAQFLHWFLLRSCARKLHVIKSYQDYLTPHYFNL